MRKTFLLPSFLCILPLLGACTETPVLTTDTPPIIPMPAEARWGEGSVPVKDIIRETGHDEIPPEGYRLHIDGKGVCLTARDEAGLFYGEQTLKQILQEDGTARPCDLLDYPAFPYRGLHLDVSRHFMSTDYIKSLLDLMATYKLNRFHWHLTDGGGWRFESKKYPLLTRKAQARTQSDWTSWWEEGDRQFVETGTPGSYGGFYTQEEMKEIADYAAQRQITVIPEIEMPGHSNEVFFAYPELTCEKKPGSSEFCIGNPQTFEFLHGILDEVMEIFPSPYIHIGGDEASKEGWKTCPACQERMRAEGLRKEEELQSWCITEIERYLNSKGRNIIGWDEILEGGLAPNATVMSWRGEEGGKTAARMKHPVIMTPGQPLYFDHYQGSPLTEPKAIGGYNPLEKVYAYNPLPADLSPEDQRYILGAQANLWTEYVPDEAHAQYMTWPRALALAEALWTPARKKDYDDFLLRANIHTRKLIREGVHAYPLSNIDLSSTVDTLHREIRVRVRKENLQARLRYTTDGSQPDFRSPVCDSVIRVQEAATLRFQLFNGKQPVGKGVSLTTGYHLGIGKKASYRNPWNSGYPAGGEGALTDGKRGGWTYLDGLWQGFTQPMDVVIDLGEIQQLEQISAEFMQVKGAWVYTPGTVEVLLSDDGENFHSIGTRQTAISTEDSGIRFELHKFNTSESARYVRMKATQSATKEGTFLFTDEIIIF